MKIRTRITSLERESGIANQAELAGRIVFLPGDNIEELAAKFRREFPSRPLFMIPAFMRPSDRTDAPFSEHGETCNEAT